MKIVVLRRSWETLVEIGRSLTRYVPDTLMRSVVLTEDPTLMLTLAEEYREMLVVSCNSFAGTIYTGESLAADAKRRNPRLLFFVHTVVPTHSCLFDGILVSSPSKQDIVPQLLSAVLNGATNLAAIREEFSDFFYPGGYIK